MGQEFRVLKHMPLAKDSTESFTNNWNRGSLTGTVSFHSTLGRAFEAHR